MSSAVSPIANAVVAYSTFDSLGLRRTGQYVVGSLICFWNSQNTKKNGEFMGITLLLLDELVRTVSNLFASFCFFIYENLQIYDHLKVVVTLGDQR